MGTTSSGGLGASLYLQEVHGVIAGKLAAVDMASEKKLHALMRKVLAQPGVRAVHDVGEGGILWALAEMTFGDGSAGGEFKVPCGKERPEEAVFGEGAGRILVELDEASLAAVENLAKEAGVEFTHIGRTGGKDLKVTCGDIYTLNTYKRLSSQSAEAAAAYLEAQRIYGRDNSRTPFQWDGSTHAGFTTGTPWIKINPDFTSVNAESAEQDPASTLHYFRDLIRLRKAEPTLIYGAYKLLDEDNPQVYAYTRSLGDEVFLILLNFSSRDARVDPGNLNLEAAKRIMANYAEENPTRTWLRPCEAVIYRL